MSNGCCGYAKLAIIEPIASRSSRIGLPNASILGFAMARGIEGCCRQRKTHKANGNEGFHNDRLVIIGSAYCFRRRLYPVLAR